MYGGIRTGQVSVDNTSGGVLIAAARSGRGSITIINGGTTDVFIGDSGLTIGTGALLVGVKGASITISSQAAIYGIAGSAQTVSYLEAY